MFLTLVTLPSYTIADAEPARGKLLVATDLVRGADFQQSVILLLHYDSTGAAGLIVNRPMGTHPGEALPDLEGVTEYEGTLFFGGPVETQSLRALMKSSDPPQDSSRIVGDVYIVPIDEKLLEKPAAESTLRFYFGYAGWAPGQLDAEMLQGSWDVVAATDEIVFAPRNEQIWQRLAPKPTFRTELIFERDYHLLSGLDLRQVHK